MPPISIGTSLEPDWNLIGTSSELRRMITEGKAEDRYNKYIRKIHIKTRDINY
jgi:hypothetical protein